MALVAYDNSDSEYDEDEESNATVVTLIKNPAAPKAQIVDKPATSESDPESPALFNLLPQPSTKKPAVLEEDDEFLHKKEMVTELKPKAKITVPSLSDFKDVDSTAPSIKPKSTNAKKSGLLSMLPQPRNAISSTKSLIPHVLTQKPKADSVKKKSLPSVTKTEPKSLINDYSDDSEDEDVQNDFFSINKPIELPEEKVEINPTPIAPEPVVETPRTIESYFKKEEPPNEGTIEVENNLDDYRGGYEDAQSEAGSSYSNGTEVAESANNDDVVLDDEAIMKLCGARGKRRREEIQIVDVNQQEVLADARDWLLKGLMDDTTKRVSSSKRRGNEPTSQQKRKHQITYLAHQAKANEAELQNQWANNRMTKRKTQSKYGF